MRGKLFPFLAKTSVKAWGDMRDLGMAHNTHSKDVLVLSSVHKCRCATKRKQKKQEKSEKREKKKKEKGIRRHTLTTAVWTTALAVAAPVVVRPPSSPVPRRPVIRHPVVRRPLARHPVVPSSIVRRPVVHRPSSRRPRPHRRRAPEVRRRTPRRAGPAADENARSPGAGWVRLVVVVRRPLPPSSAVRRHRPWSPSVLVVVVVVHIVVRVAVRHRGRRGRRRSVNVSQSANVGGSENHPVTHRCCSTEDGSSLIRDYIITWINEDTAEHGPWSVRV